MDTGPFGGAGRTTDRRAATNRGSGGAATTHHASAEPPARAAHDEPHAATVHSHADVHHRAAGKSKKHGSRKQLLVGVIIGLAVAALAVAAWQLWPSATGIDGSKYRAVFFTNGQVYFGKLTRQGDNFHLTDVYYLQTQNSSSGDDTKDPQNTSSDQNVQLIKLGDEVHGPEDKMIINKDQVLFYENLKSDGKVAQTIAQAKENK